MLHVEIETTRSNQSQEIDPSDDSQRAQNRANCFRSSSARIAYAMAKAIVMRLACTFPHPPIHSLLPVPLALISASPLPGDISPSDCLCACSPVIYGRLSSTSFVSVLCNEGNNSEENMIRLSVLEHPIRPARWRNTIPPARSAPSLHSLLCFSPKSLSCFRPFPRPHFFSCPACAHGPDDCLRHRPRAAGRDCGQVICGPLEGGPLPSFCPSTPLVAGWPNGTQVCFRCGQSMKVEMWGAVLARRWARGGASCIMRWQG
jgi:hypothetical protein